MIPPTPSQILAQVLDRFARWLRWFAALRGAALWLLAAIVAAAFSLAADYSVEPTRGVRFGILVALAAALLFVLARWVISPLLIRWPPSALAAAMERRIPAMNERLVTAVELEEFPAAPALIARVHTEAAEQARVVSPTAVLSIRSTLRLVMLAITAGMIVAVLAVTNSGLAQTWWRRAVLLEAVRYPRQTAVVVDGFVNGVRKVGRGRDAEIVVKTSGRIPERATLDFVNVPSGQRRRVLNGSGGEFHHRFHGVVQPIEFTVQAGDERTDVLRLQPVDPPAIREVESTVEPPAYTGLGPSKQRWTNGPINAPVGSHVAVQMAFDGPVVILDAKSGGRAIEFQRLGSETCLAAWVAGESKRLAFRFANVDGVEADELFVLDVNVIPDRPPIFEKIEPANVGPAVTRLAALPISLTLIDDYAVEQAAAILTTTGSGATHRVPLPDLPHSGAAQKPVVELGPYGFKEGEKFTLHLEASDLPPAGPFLGEPLTSQWAQRTVRSPSFAFEVVAPDELQARLAAREINHRLRFEQTLRELRDARRTLGDANADAGATLQRLRVEEVLQSARKTANETRELSAAFFGLVEEFRNNRVGASGMLERLERSVAGPLLKLADESFPQRVREIQAATDALGSPGFRKAAERAGTGLDALVREGESVLASMRKMENFNELVTTLRTLRDEQSKLLQETKEERKRRILDLVK